MVASSATNPTKESNAMNKDSKNFRDGRIEEVTSTPDCVKLKMLCKAVESGELTVEINSHAEGWLHIHFSGLGGKVVKTVQTAANGVDIMVKV